MISSSSPETQRGRGTVGIFNFIRRIGFPTSPEIFSVLLTLILLSSLLGFPFLGLGIASALRVGLIDLAIPTLGLEFLVSRILLRDKVLDYRRILGLELISWAPMLLFSLLAAAFTILTGLQPSWQEVVLITLATSLPIRFLTFVSLLQSSTFVRIAASIAVPFGVGVTILISDPRPVLEVISSLGLVTVVCGLGVLSLVRRLDREGIRQVGTPPMPLFRAFLKHWLNHDASDLEQGLYSLGVDDEIRTRILAFYGKDPKTPKGAVVVSSFHPGPYRDLGSGGLPSNLKKRLEERYGGIVHVPHAASGHQSNIIRSADIEALVQSLESIFPTKPKTATASQLVRTALGDAKAGGQIFSKTALIALTLSPLDMEDIPAEVDEAVSREASVLGVEPLVVDAHNSMNSEVTVSSRQTQELAMVASEALNKLCVMDQTGFKAGFAHDELSMFNPEDGIGPGGASAMVVSCEGQNVAYLTIDGNNMLPGFREEILSGLREIGVADGEVMTTDTHLVTGLVRSPLGYYQVGAHVNKEMFLREMKSLVRKAIEDLEDVRTDTAIGRITVRVLGKETFQKVTGYIRTVGTRVRNLFYLLEVVSVALTLMILLLF